VRREALQPLQVSADLIRLGSRGGALQAMGATVTGLGRPSGALPRRLHAGQKECGEGCRPRMLVRPMKLWEFCAVAGFVKLFRTCLRDSRIQRHSATVAVPARCGRIANVDA
jgi:hypothetical protein